VPGSYPRSLAAATQLTAGQLAAEDPAAAELASLCAFLAPEPISEDLFTAAAGELPRRLAARARKPLAWRQTVGRLAGRSLARADAGGLVMHRLTQAILRDRLTPAQATATRARAGAVLAVSNPRDPANPATWPRWARLIPHLLAAGPAATASPGLRWMACNACWYLLARGDTRTAHDLATGLCQQWRERLGDDDEHTRAATHYLAWSLRDMGATPRPAACTKTPWTGPAASWATTTPTPWSTPPASPATCTCWGRWRRPGTWTRTPWSGAAGCSAPTTPTP
jgi:hypothetical protein